VRIASCRRSFIFVWVFLPPGFPARAARNEWFRAPDPLVLAAGRFAVAAGGVRRTAPREHLVKRVPQQRFLGVHRGQQLAIGIVLAHECVAGVARRRGAAGFQNGVPFLTAAQTHLVIEFERAPHVGAGGALVAETCVAGAIVA